MLIGSAHVECTERTEWLAELAQIKNEVPTENETQGYVNPKMFIRKLSAKLPENTICVADVGQNQIWTANNIFLKNGRFLTSGGMGTMGYSIPAAVGAKLSSSDSQVIAICGDGSFQMQMMELATAVQHGINIKVIVMVNNCLGMVREVQENHYENRLIAVDLSGSPRYDIIAQAYGIESLTVTDEKSAHTAIKLLLESEKPYLIQVMVNNTEKTII